VATGSVTEPLVCVILGIVLLEERLAPPTWHKVVAFVGLGIALAAAVAISIAREGTMPSARSRCSRRGLRMSET
jgi:EamA domain-containing membrane protein RarD